MNYLNASYITLILIEMDRVFSLYQTSRVVINGVKSDRVAILSGVPQGTVLDDCYSCCALTILQKILTRNKDFC